MWSIDCLWFLIVLLLYNNNPWKCIVLSIFWILFLSKFRRAWTKHYTTDNRKDRTEFVTRKDQKSIMVIKYLSVRASLNLESFFLHRTRFSFSYYPLTLKSWLTFEFNFFYRFKDTFQWISTLFSFTTNPFFYSTSTVYLCFSLFRLIFFEFIPHYFLTHFCSASVDFVKRESFHGLNPFE